MRRASLVLALAVAALAIVAVGIGTGLIRAVPAPSPAAALASQPGGPAVTGIGGTQPPTATPEASPSPPGPSAVPPAIRSRADRPEILTRLQVALDEGRAAIAAPGVQASVIFPDGHQWIGVSGVADLASARPLTTTTPFAVASVSKTFVAAEVLELVDGGQVSLADSVARLLPTTDVGGRPIDPAITVAMLLDHTSGLGDFLISPSLDDAVQADPRAVWTPDEALAFAGRPAAKPGVGYHYANTNYVLLGLIVERVTGRTLAAELRSRFFDPLGLATASYQGVEPPTAQLPTAYRYSSIRLTAPPRDVTDGSAIRPFTAITTAAGAAGSVAASAGDLARWARDLYGGWVLSPEMLAAMVGDATTTRTLAPGYPYGLGIQEFTIDGRLTYGHSGRLVGARSVVRWFPDAGVAVAVVSNQSRFDLTPIVRDLVAIAAPRPIASGERPT